MKKQVNDNIDIQIYASDSATTDVTIGDWKSERTTIDSAITRGKRLCTYADIVVDYIKMSKEVMNALDITVLPHQAESVINDIVIVRGRECVPYTSASNSDSLYVRLKKNSSSEIVKSFNLSGEFGEFPKIWCNDYIDPDEEAETIIYDYTSVIGYESINLDIDSENINKKLCITLHNFDLKLYVSTNNEQNYSATVGADAAQNIGILKYNDKLTTEISSPRKIYFDMETRRT